MPSSSVRTFTDPDEYAADSRASTIDLMITERGQFNAKRTWIDFHHLWMQQVFENTARTWRASLVAGRAVVTFRAQAGQSLHWSGIELLPDNLIRNAEGQETFAHSSSPASMGFLSLPLSDMVSVGEAMAGLDAMPPKDPLV